MRLRKHYHLMSILILPSELKSHLYCINLEVLPLHRSTPIDKTLVCDCGTGIGGCQSKVARVVRGGIGAAPMSKARVALGARRATVWRRMASNRSTARKVTTWARGKPGRATRVWSRSAITLMLVNVSARATSRRKAAFL